MDRSKRSRADCNAVPRSKLSRLLPMPQLGHSTRCSHATRNIHKNIQGLNISSQTDSPEIDNYRNDL